MDNQILISPKESYTVKVKPYRGMGFLLFCFFPIFLFNPDVGIIDFIPDFIGYIFPLIALSKLRDLSEKFEDAYKRIGIAALVSVGKLVSVFLSFGFIGPGEGGYQSSMMLFSLVFFALELLFVIPAFRSFFSAIYFMGEIHSCPYISGDIIKKNGKRKKNRTDRISNATTVFIAARAVCAMLPQLSIMSSHGFDDTVYDFSRFHGLFMAIGFIVCLCFSVWWIIKAYIYFIGLCKQKEFKVALKENYLKKVQSKKISFILRNVGTFTSVLTVAAFFGIDLFINDSTINVIPDILFALMMMASVLLIPQLMKPSRKLSVISCMLFAVYAVTSLIKDWLHADYFRNHTMFAYYRDPSAYSLYNSFTAVSVIDAIILAACVIMMTRIIAYIEKGYAISKLSIENDSIQRMNNAESREFARSYITPLAVTGIIAAFVTMLTPFVLKLSATTFAGVSDETMQMVSFIVGFTATYWAIDLTASLVLAIMFTRTLSALKDRVETKLMLD